jgi:hypothetical protein
MSCEDTWLARLHWHVQLLHHLCSRESQGTQAHIRPESTGQAFLPPTIFTRRFGYGVCERIPPPAKSISGLSGIC